MLTHSVCVCVCEWFLHQTEVSDFKLFDSEFCHHRSFKNINDLSHGELAEVVVSF